MLLFVIPAWSWRESRVSAELSGKIFPEWIRVLDQSNLPPSLPLLQLLLALNRRCHGGMAFEVDQYPDGVLLRESVDRAELVSPHTLVQVGCDTGVECAIAFAGQNIDAGTLGQLLPLA